MDAVADWLVARVRTDAAGVQSLAHVLVVVPTAQSGRRLRHALARRFPSGLVPPRVKMPAHLVDISAPDIAGRADELIAWREARDGKGGFDVAAELAGVRHILGANALSFADVAAKVGDILKDDLVDVEVDRWQDLAKLEVRYLASLKRRGKRDGVSVLKEALEKPVAFPGIDEVVVAWISKTPPKRKVFWSAGFYPRYS